MTKSIKDSRMVWACVDYCMGFSDGFSVSEPLPEIEGLTVKRFYFSDEDVEVWNDDEDGDKVWSTSDYIERYGIMIPVPDDASDKLVISSSWDDDDGYLYLEVSRKADRPSVPPPFFITSWRLIDRT